MTSAQMARKRRTYTIDERLIEALAKMAAASNASANRFLENLLWEKATSDGFIPKNEKPLGETRGGDRTSEATEA
ncbi:MAG: hypothetical protein HLUCCA11_21280 [Phormidesmis priestleyi Ana]|uniref:Ribbon-helix-helix protein, copG family n=1 Tax=Phormidesmis priestleyi Ana TaxID=1666911 RepID=A0A0P7YQ21_9CYAN|nr:MAG: hypothetical protein HLUCCA11_21280 [Phormidesmis priestleyi Ana]